MNVKVAIYGLWFLFALWSYVTIIYSTGFIWFLFVKSRRKKYDLYSNVFDVVFWTITFAGQILTVYLYITSGQDLSKNNENVTTPYLVLLIVNFVAVVGYLFYLLFFSNNFEVKFTEKKLCLVLFSILNSTIIKVARNAKGHLVLEYIYKKEANKIWTEKLVFHKWFSLADFIEANYLSYFDPERNQAILKLKQVEKISGSKEETKKVEESALSDQKVVSEKITDKKSNGEKTSTP